jgi:hypothetical protein
VRESVRYSTKFSGGKNTEYAGLFSSGSFIGL